MGLLPGGPLAGREVSPMKGVFVKEKVAKYRVGKYEVYRGRLVGWVVADDWHEVVYLPDIRTAIRVADDLADEDYLGVIYTIKSRVKNYWQRAWWHDFKAWCDNMAIEKAMGGWR